MPGEYSSLEELVSGERAYARAHELGRVVKLLNELIDRKQEAARALGLEGADAVEELRRYGWKDISWADIMLVAAPAVLREAIDIVRK